MAKTLSMRGQVCCGAVVIHDGSRYSVTYRSGEQAERHRFDTLEAAKAWLVSRLDWSAA
jgi:hypothetical protein